MEQTIQKEDIEAESQHEEASGSWKPPRELTRSKSVSKNIALFSAPLKTPSRSTKPEIPLPAGSVSLARNKYHLQHIIKSGDTRAVGSPWYECSSNFTQLFCDFMDQEAKEVGGSVLVRIYILLEDYYMASSKV